MTAPTPEESAAVLEGVRQVVGAHRSHDAAKSTEGLDVSTWTGLREAGFTRIGIPESAEGLGDAAGLALNVTRTLVEERAVVPYADAVGLGAWLVEKAGFDIGAEVAVPLVDARQWDGLQPVPAAAVLRRSGVGWTLDVHRRHVPWARTADQLVFVDADLGRIARVSTGDCVIAHKVTLAGEPADNVTVSAASAEVAEIDGPAIAQALLLRGALYRAAAMCGAMDAILRTSVSYVVERQQFGGRLVQLGAVQQLLAELAAEIAVCDAAVGAATNRADEAVLGTTMPLAIIAAKARVSRAARVVTAIAHQLHGAMGITTEYPLEFWSRRLLAWRDEYGAERFWEQRLGKCAANLSSDVLWSGIVTAGASWERPRDHPSVIA